MIDAATLRLRYPAFTAVATETIDYWLTDAARIVDKRFGDEQEAATLALAAHNMARNGVTGLAGASQLPAGVTSFRSAQFSATVSEAAAQRVAAGGYGSTIYGGEFEAMLRRAGSGPYLVGAVYAECEGWPC